MHRGLDNGEYPGGVKINDERMRYLEERVIVRHAWQVELRHPPRPR